eukprot:sb/3479288/
MGVGERETERGREREGETERERTMGEKDYLSGAACCTISATHMGVNWSSSRQLIEIKFMKYLTQEPTETSKQPIRARYLGHVTGYISQSGTSIS